MIERTPEDHERFNADMRRIAASKAKTNAHTPGPWVSENDGGRLVILGMDRCDTGIQVEPLYPVGGDPECPDYKTWEANARLIAAAPALLEACKAVVESMSAAPVLETDWKLPGSYDAWKSCVVAIEAAEGRAS
jgi:hypothetical protein